jgi:hypothetical protein
MVQNQTIDETRFYVEDLVPSIESFLESRDDSMPLLEYPRLEGAEMYGEELASGFASKRRRISL